MTTASAKASDQPVLEKVRITPDDNAMLIISPVWAGVDRPTTSSFALRSNQRTLAERFKRCIEDGKAFASTRIVIDNNGKTYVDTHMAFRHQGSHLDKNLKALGY